MVHVGMGQNPTLISLRGWSSCVRSVRPTTNFGVGVGVCTGGCGNGCRYRTNYECAKGLRKRAGVFDWK